MQHGREGGAKSLKPRQRERKKREGLCVWEERESECASSIKRAEREGGKRKSVSASLFTAPGLRDSSSLRSPRCRFNSIPSVQSFFLFLFFFVCASCTGCFSSGVALASFCTPGGNNSFIYQRRCLELQRGLFFLSAKDGGKTAVSSGTWSLACVAAVDFPVLPCQCFVRGSRQTVGVAPLTSLHVPKDRWKRQKLVLLHARGGLFASDRCHRRRRNKFYRRPAYPPSGPRTSAPGLQRSLNERSTELFSRPPVPPGESS